MYDHFMPQTKPMAFRSNPEDHSHLQGSNRELRDTITHHLTNLGKPADGDDRALGMVMLAGANKGAVMKAEFLDKVLEKGGDEKKSAYANGNYQAVNNSIVIDGQCHAEDPGIHIEIVDYFDDHHEKKEEGQHHHVKEGKEEKDKENKKGK